ncbi:MAG: hypothetical protein JWM85_3421 [Acidimicrobiaceae bacterium]|nr:hypothetical protein [Acidimicrobiaceae bacterium]
MQPSQWAEYLDSFAAFLDRARAGFDGSGPSTPEEPPPRPSGPPPEALAVRALELLAETERCILAGEQRKAEVSDACRNLAYRARTRSRVFAFDEAL